MSHTTGRSQTVQSREVRCHTEKSTKKHTKLFELSGVYKTDVPTMLIPGELEYLYTLGKSMRGNGRAVEIGCFLGGSTAAIDDGLLQAKMDGPYRESPLLVYDSFDLPSDSDTSCWWLKPFGLTPGQSFRPAYEDIHRARLHRLLLREGWLPESSSLDQRTALYPEQDPIELLFIDAGKTWGVHRTILQSFTEHVIPNATVIQQDFMDLLPWISLHMWQLRDYFSPSDLIADGSTLAFTCHKTPSRSALDSLYTFESLQESRIREKVFACCAEYFESHLPGIGSAIVSAYRSVDAFHRENLAESVVHARAYEAWTMSRARSKVFVSLAWPNHLRNLTESRTSITPQSTANECAHRLFQEHAARTLVPSRTGVNSGTGFIGTDERIRTWTKLFQSHPGLKSEQVALYGAGQHTAWLLEAANVFPVDLVACILDDSPRENLIGGVPVISPRELESAFPNVRVIVPSSDAHERSIIERAEKLFTGRDIDIVPVYTSYESLDVEEPIHPRPPETLQHTVKPDELQQAASHRTDLGLDSNRPWLDSFCRWYGTPEWASGFVIHRDALMLWDLVEASQPHTVLEIGTASGVSTAIIAAALHELVPESRTSDSPRVHAFDIAQRCYFDTTKLVGEAIHDIVPTLQHMISINRGSTAVDAARAVPVETVDLAFIDGDHRHPAPTLDLLCILYALKPGAWVCLHDIVLPELTMANPNADWDPASGAQKLFEAWPFEKVSPDHADPMHNNIGAIRMPQQPADAVPVLIELLEGSWEMAAPDTQTAALLGCDA